MKQPDPELGEGGFIFFSGFESTYMPGHDLDVLETTRHVEFVEEDIARARRLNLRYLRYSAPWHRVEHEQGVFRWDWMDRAMAAIQQNSIQPIVDLVHHTSYPPWMDQGFADPRLPEALTRFAETFAERYPWVTWYTVFNEPFVTCLLCGCDGVWPPFHKGGPRTFIPMLVNVSKAICRATRAIRQTTPHARFMHVDTCEKHHAVDEGGCPVAEERNNLRFLGHDLVLGRIDQQHPLWGHLVENGLSEKAAGWLRENRAQIDMIGLDYYSHSELGHRGNGEVIVPTPQPSGFATVARDYQQRFDLPMVLAETNLRGTVEDRLTWMRHMLQQVHACAQDGRPLHGFGWYPLIDSCDWDSLLLNPRGHVDPQGIYVLSEDRSQRIESALTEWYAKLADGSATWQDLPAIPFSEMAIDRVRSHRDNLMRDWFSMASPRSGP